MIPSFVLRQQSARSGQRCARPFHIRRPTSRRGRFVLKRKSRSDRMRAKLKEIKEEMRRRRHQPVPEQGKCLRQVVAGFFEYHAVPTNSRALNTFRHHVTNLWRRSLRQRSQKIGSPGAGSKSRQTILAPSPHHSSVAGCTLRRQTPQGGSRVPQSGMLGSVGALSNERSLYVAGCLANIC